MAHSRLGATLLFALTASFAVTGTAGTNAWTVKGPPGGMFRDVEASSTAPNVFYAAYQHTLHRSSDGGVTWSTIRDFSSQLNDIAVDPSDGNRLYVSTYEEGLFRSEDGGQTFTTVAAAPFGMWGVGTSATTVYYSTNSRTFHRSTDRGQTWTQTNPFTPNSMTKILVDPQNADVIYAIAGPFLERSTDGGATWTQTSIGAQPLTYIYGLAQLSTTQLVAALQDGLYSSSDRGDTWTRTVVGSFRSVVADATTPGRAIASPFGGQLQVTTNYGSSWSTLGSPPSGSIEGFAVDSQSPAHMVILNRQVALRTANNAQSWTDATQSPIASSIMHFATTVANASKVYTYTGSSGLFATRGDAGWERLGLPGNELGQASLAVKPGVPDSIYLGTFGLGVFRSNDGGRIWIPPNSDLNGFSVQAMAFDPLDLDIMYAQVYAVSSTPSTGLYRSTNGGASWLPQSVNLGTNIFGMDLKIDPADPSRMFIGAYQGFGPANTGALYRSTDRGVNWTQAAFIGEDVRKVAIDPANSSRMYVATTSGLQVSSNGGDSFTPNSQFAIITHQAATSVAIDPVVPSTLYAISSGRQAPPYQSSYVLRSVDQGQTWETLRDAAVMPTWSAVHLELDPNNPALIYVSTGVRGVGSFEIAPDLSLQLTGHSGTRPANVESSFNLRAVNNGPYAATAVRLAATLPAGLTGVSVTADRGTCTTGASVTCIVPVLRVGEEINAVVRFTPSSSVALAVAATASAHENDAASADNSAIGGEVVDLTVAVTPSATSVTRGANLTYTVNVSNAGSVESSAGTLTLTLGSGFTLGAAPNGCTVSGASFSCSTGAMASGASQSFSFPVVATEAGTIAATAAVAIATSAIDMNTANNTATASVTATSPPPPDNGGGNNGGGGGGGGGGTLNLGALAAMLTLLACRRRRLQPK